MPATKKRPAKSTAKKPARAKRSPKNPLAPDVEPHKWTNGGGKVLLLKAVNADMTAHGGFKWPAAGPVEPTNWTPTQECGGGLHGWPWSMGLGDGRDYSLIEDKWIVFAADPADVIGNVGKGPKAKARRAEVVYCGTFAGAMALLKAGLSNLIVAMATSPAGSKSGDYAKLAASGNSATLAASGHYATLAASGHYAKLAASGDSATLTASGDSAKLAASGHSATLAASGHYAKLAASGDSATLTASGDSAKLAASGHSATLAASGHYAKLAASGDSATLTASGDSAKLAASGHSAKLAASGNSATLTASGDSAKLAASGHSAKLAASGNSATLAASGKNAVCMSAATGATVTVGEGGVFALVYRDTSDQPHIVTARAGEAGIVAGQAYTLNTRGEIVKVTA